MPFGNRMGPGGAGPRTGRGAGYCGGYGAPGYTNPVTGYGFGMRGCWGGGGHGWRHWYYATGVPGWARTGWGARWDPSQLEPAFAPPTRELEIEELKTQAKYFEESLKAIGKRIEELGASRSDEK